jgi:membrane-anchored protein YejM (alkaline phosphatase superfamily)
LQYAGYQNNGTAFSPGLKANLDYVDQSFARILAALTSSGNAATTGLVITAKHGQQPVTTNATLISPTPIATALKNQNIRCCKPQTHHLPDQVVFAGRRTSVMVC